MNLLVYLFPIWIQLRATYDQTAIFVFPNFWWLELVFQNHLWLNLIELFWWYLNWLWHALVIPICLIKKYNLLFMVRQIYFVWAYIYGCYANKTTVYRNYILWLGRLEALGLSLVWLLISLFWILRASFGWFIFRVSKFSQTYRYISWLKNVDLILFWELAIQQVIRVCRIKMIILKKVNLISVNLFWSQTFCLFKLKVYILLIKFDGRIQTFFNSIIRKFDLILLTYF